MRAAADQTGQATLWVTVKVVSTCQRIVSIGNGACKIGAVIFQRRQGQIAAVIERIQRQASLVVIERRTAGVMVLLQMLADKPGLIGTVNLPGQRRCFGRLRQFCRRIGLMLTIAEYAAPLRVQQFNRQTTREITGHGLHQGRSGAEIDTTIEQ
ncbi:hypothetical protein D3C78_1124610 [compost metagenome]